MFRDQNGGCRYWRGGKFLASMVRFSHPARRIRQNANGFIPKCLKNSYPLVRWLLDSRNPPAIHHDADGGGWLPYRRRWIHLSACKPRPPPNWTPSTCAWRIDTHAATGRLTSPLQ